MYCIMLPSKETICKSLFVYTSRVLLLYSNNNCTCSAAERIIMRSRQLVDVRKDDGFAALHLASLNGHVQVVIDASTTALFTILFYIAILL